jgi:hypothetical protein
MMGRVVCGRLMLQGMLVSASKAQHEFNVDGCCPGILPMSPELSQFPRVSGALVFGKCALDSRHLPVSQPATFVYFAIAARVCLQPQPASHVNAPLIGRNDDWVGASEGGANGWSSKVV